MKSRIIVAAHHLVRSWFAEGQLPIPISNAAFRDFKAGVPPCRRLFKMPKPQWLRGVVDGGRS